MKILVVTGASGGHVFPALAFLQALHIKRGGVSLFLALPKSAMKMAVAAEAERIIYLPVTPIRLGLGLKNIIALCSFAWLTVYCLYIILRFKPSIVAGFGSIACVPMLFWARLLGAKTMIHEQNVIPGRANRILAGIVDTVAISFEKTRGYLGPCRAKVVCTGNPLRSQLQRCDKAASLDFLGLRKDKTTILVMGGSQGSSSINRCILKALSRTRLKDNVQVVHLAGARDAEWLRKGYQDAAITHSLFVFLDQMQYAYSASDLVISRAGAMTISELIYFQLPAILIPYPYAYAHQLENARILKEAGTAEIVLDHDLDGDALTQTLERLIHEPQPLEAMRLKYRALAQVDAKKLLVDEAIRMVEC
jgi:UDP-N-acetylglucosamine--N-acetylmuramyl-(pentapeptide) pyrophosphoryl-undecaprenol N-acetylglucosamine transferase